METLGKTAQWSARDSGDSKDLDWILWTWNPKGERIITMMDVSQDTLYYWTGLMLVLGLIQELKHSLCEVK